MSNKVVILLVLVSYNMAVNPGVNGFLNTNFFNTAKNVLWPTVQQCLTNIEDLGSKKVKFGIGEVKLHKLNVTVNAGAHNVYL